MQNFPHARVTVHILSYKYEGPQISLLLRKGKIMRTKKGRNVKEKGEHENKRNTKGRGIG
jgi:hypothetical protein